MMTPGKQTTLISIRNPEILGDKILKEVRNAIIFAVDYMLDQEHILDDLEDTDIEKDEHFIEFLDDLTVPFTFHRSEVEEKINSVV